MFSKKCCNFVPIMIKTSDTALLIINYGTPQNADKRSVKRFLRQLLNSKHVITMNDFGRNLLVNCCIVPFRIKHSLKLYQHLNEKYGLLLKNITEDFAEKVQKTIQTKADVFIGMTAGYNLVKDICADILRQNYKNLIVAPMFPHYTESTWGKALDDVFSSLKGQFNIPHVTTIDTFYNNPYYLQSISEVIKNNLKDFDFDKIVFSYHGVPVSHNNISHPGHTCEELGCRDHVNKDNQHCYLAQCYESTRLIAKELGVSLDKCITSFQSRMSDRWVTPYTSDEVSKLASSGVKKIAVITPAFTVDCLETVIEIGETLSSSFISQGGQELKLIPCLNADDNWVENFCKMILN